MKDNWTTAHLAALAWQDAAFAFVPQPQDFAGRTVRQAVRLRRGGAAVRLVLSNEYGDGPLIIDGMTVGVGGGGDAPDGGRGLGSARPVLLNGRARWEIPAGETATGDPVALTAAAGDDLLVSCFLAGHVPSATYLHSAQRTGEAAPGDQLGRPQLTGAAPFSSLHWIARVLVDAPASGPVVVAYGDSITRGDGTPADREERYPDHLRRRLHAAGVGGAVVLNAGLGANRLLRTGLGPSMGERFERDVLGAAEATHVIIMGGANDIALPGLLGDKPVAADEITDGLLALASRARQHGIRPVLGTITPFGGSTFASFRSEGSERIRQDVNHAIRSQRDWPVVDFAAAVAAPDDPARLAAAYDSGDGVHPGGDGARVLADAVDPALFA